MHLSRDTDSDPHRSSPCLATNVGRPAHSHRHTPIRSTDHRLTAEDSGAVFPRAQQPDRLMR